MDEQNRSSQEANTPHLRELIFQYLRYWPWFLITVLLALATAFLYLRYTTAVYESSATILIKDDKNGGLSELAAFQDLGLSSSNVSGFEDELLILKSKSLTERVVRELDLNIRYFAEGNVKTAELYKGLPFNVFLLHPSDSMDFSGASFYILPKSEKKFDLWNESQSSKIEYAFGDTLSLSTYKIVVRPNLKVMADRDNTNLDPIKVVINSILATVEASQRDIQVSQIVEKSNGIRLSMTSSNTERSEDILNELIHQYNEDAKEDRNMVARNTANFIAGRLVIISEELDSVETGKVEFKQSNKLTDIAVEGEIFLQSESEFTNKVLEVETKLELAKNIIDYVRNGSKSDLLPTNLGIEGEGTSSAITAYNHAVLERNRLLRSSTEKNPVVINLDNQISELKLTVLEGLINSRRALEIKKNDLNAQEARLGSKLSAIPPKEKIFRSIVRQQEIKETLYLYLLQKREENAITMAVTTPKAKIVDYAYSSRMPVAPKKKIVMLAAFIIGLLIPFSVIYLRDILDNKIRDKSTIESRSKDNPVIGEIPKLEKRDTDLVQRNDRSLLAESFRLLITNLQYLFLGDSVNETKGKTIMVTSSIKGEGKTFVSVNLALTLADSGAKVVLVGADIRNPQLQRYDPDAPFKRGLVEYLVHDDILYNELLQQSEIHENLKILFSGSIPPNPAKLLMQPRVNELFETLRSNFDYIVVDTAPAMLVTDTFLINKYADTTLFVMRVGVSDKNLIDFALDTIKTKKLKNVAFILNSVNFNNFGYGNRYEYYHIKKETAWEKFKKRF